MAFSYFFNSIKKKPKKESLSPELADKKIKYLEISCFKKFYYLFIRQYININGCCCFWNYNFIIWNFNMFIR